MIKGVVLVFVMLISMSVVSAVVSSDSCNVDISLLNQDPYPAVQGDYVKLVFQVNGLQNEKCGEVYIELLEEFPVKFDTGSEKSFILNSGEYLPDYSNYALVPFKVRIDESALNKEYEVKIKYASKYDSNEKLFLTKRFNISLQESQSDFEINVKDYNFETQIATFEIINVGKTDVEALTIDMPKQDSFSVKGSSRYIVGSLDKNDDTSFTFEGIPRDGDIKFKLSYNDPLDVRRNAEISSLYDSSQFAGRIKDVEKPNYTGYIVIAILVVLLIFWIIARIRHKRKLEKMKLMRRQN